MNNTQNLSEEIRIKVLEKLQSSVEPRQYETWLKKLEFVESDSGELKIPLPNIFYVEWYKKSFLPLIETAVCQVTGKEHKIIFVAPPEQGRLFPDNIVADKKPSFKQSIVTSNSGQRSQPEERASLLDFALSENFIFEKFVVGTSNRLAHAAALAVAENPGQAYNPLFIHGGVGLGKTHLLQAIAHRIINKFVNYSIYYRSGEEFVNDYITAVKNNAFELFRKQCRSEDVMIIDDIHFLGRGEKAASREEFFHTFNALHNARKQIILSSDSPPKDMPLLQDRLVSRFNWGMVARLDTPDYEMRVAILRQKSENYKITIPDNVVSFIASNVDTNIRDLEGSLIRLIGLARSSNQNPSVALATESLKDIINFTPHQIKISDIMDVIAGYFNVSSLDLQSKVRIKSVSLARQIALYLARQLKPEMSLEEIGLSFGGREHSTVLHSIEKIRKRAQKDSKFRDTLNTMLTEIRRKNV
jgi:chromosomal replication initiator protein